MDQLYSWFSEPLDNLAGTRVGTPVMVLLGIVMFGAWTMTYITLIRKCRKDKSYGIPFPNVCLNASWELIFSTNLAGGLPKFAFPLQLGHALWLIPDAFIIGQLIKYGPQMHSAPFMKKHFHTILALTFVVSFLLIYTYHFYARDVYGVASSWIINVFMSWFFIAMLVNRRMRVMDDGTIQGMSIRAAWYKLVGNAAGVVFCFFWWPAQFGNMGMFIHKGIEVREPPSYLFLYVLYVVNLVLDVMLIVMLRKREAEIRARTEAAPEHVYQLV
jgi:hypothetical protein